jgi:hypothetical protein
VTSDEKIALNAAIIKNAIKTLFLCFIIACENLSTKFPPLLIVHCVDKQLYV